MQLHLASADYTAALRAYENCRSLLDRELKATPSPETEGLADRIRSHASPPAPSLASRTAPLRDSTHTLTSLSPLIGRVSEHTTLVTASRLARRGQPQVVTLEGEPGIGKTRLGTEFARWAAAQGATVLSGRAFETGGRLPYQPVVEALRQTNLHLPGTTLSPIWLAELTRLLPELRDHFPDLPEPLTLDQPEAQTRLFEAVARFGQALAERGPLVMFIDDVQWADAASLDLLHYIARRWASVNAPALLLFAVRSEDLDPLTDWLTGLGRELRLIRLTLAPLTQEDTLALIQALRAGHPLGETLEVGDSNLHASRLISNLYADTGGHPLFIVETIKSLREEGGQVGIPPGVRDVIHARLNRLSANALTLCTAAAILGSQFDFDSLCRVAGLNENDGLPALDELLRRGLLREADRRYLFSHDRIREIVYAQASEARRRVFHRRALEVLATTLALSIPSAELAHHALAANLPERAFELSLAAGDEAMRLFAVHDAVRHYEQAQALMAILQLPIPDLHASRLFSQLGRAYELTNEREKARSLYQEMLVLARERKAPQMECSALNRQATLVAQDARDFEHANELLRAALAVAEANGDQAGLAETEWNLAQTAHYASNMEESLAHGERALALARALGHTELIARSLNALAYASDELGRWDETQTYATEAQALYAELGNRAMVADNLSLMAEAQIRSGQPRLGLTTAREAYGITLEIENVWGQANTAQQVALASLEIGEYGEALKAAQTGVAAAQAAGSHP
jgi:predicted ATPase